jgi:hypothetical protein
MKQKKSILLLLYLIPLISPAQKFMIWDGDTLPYAQTIKINDDTLYYGDNIIYPGDTTYSSPCYGFEKLKGKIINRTTPDCKRLGFWIIVNEDSTVSKGEYTSWGRFTGIWKDTDRKGKLVRETEYASVAQDTYILKDVVYKGGKQTIITNKSWFAKLYFRNTLLIALIILGAFFIRVPINMIILKRQHNQNPTFWIPFGTSFTESGQYMIQTMFTFW